MRRVTAGLRESPRGAVHASRPNPITWAIVLRVLAVATVVGTFLSLFGPFSPLDQWLQRSALFFAYSWIGSLLGLFSARLLFVWGFPSSNSWLIGLATGVQMAPAMGLVVWLGASIDNRHVVPLAYLPEIFWDTALICIGASMVGVLASRTRTVVAAAPAPPKFLERLPLKLRGAEIWAVEAEDHYLRLHTSKGQDLILMRLSDAVAELEGIEGAQVHRSWWVSRDAIADAKRGDGRATLTLKDGAQVPVSRTYAAILREKNWI
jgi:hypothetical protein